MSHRLVLVSALLVSCSTIPTTERPGDVIAEFTFISPEAVLPVQVLRRGVTHKHCTDASFADHSVAVAEAISATPGANIMVNVSVTLAAPENCVHVSGDAGRVE